MGQPPLHRMANATVDSVPAGAKDAGNFAPVHSTSPRGKKPFVGSGHLFFAAGPRKLLGFDAVAVVAIHPTDGVLKEHLQTENRYELKAALFTRVVRSASVAIRLIYRPPATSV